MPLQRTPQADALSDLFLAVFRMNALLIEKGDELVAPFGLTSARWQILGAISRAGEPPTAPQVAALMGVTRQGAQKQLNLAAEDGLIHALSNPRHDRSPLYDFTPRGRAAYQQVMALQIAWSNALARDTRLADLNDAIRVLTALETQLETLPLPTPATGT